MSFSIRKAGRRLAMLTGLSALMVGVGASAASASINLSPGSPFSSSGSTEVVVSGTPEGGAASATHVAVVVCNTAVIPNIGKRCDKESSSGEGLTPVSLYENEEIAIQVRRGATSTTGWPDYNYTKGTPPTAAGTTTLCKNTAVPATGEQCGVVVSYYRVEEIGGVEVINALPPEFKNILFS